MNAIVEDNYENALKEARTVDYFLNTTTQSIESIAQDMPLLGVPITIKASIAVKGENIFLSAKLFTYVHTYIYRYIHMYVCTSTKLIFRSLVFSQWVIFIWQVFLLINNKYFEKCIFNLYKYFDQYK